MSDPTAMTDVQLLQHQVASALERIQRLEENLNGGQDSARWQFLTSRPHPWRQQLCVKGRNLTVGQLVKTIRANGYTPEQASDNLDLPLAAINEALAYYAEQHDLIEMEADEEKRRVAQRGYPLEPKDLPR